MTMPPPRRLPEIDRLKQVLQYAYQHRTKNSPWVFTNPEMVIKYPNNPNHWRYSYWDKFFATLCNLKIAALESLHKKGGRVAQLGEHRPYKPGVTGSNPVPPTRKNKGLAQSANPFLFEFPDQFPTAEMETRLSKLSDLTDGYFGGRLVLTPATFFVIITL
jgi:hypothetical protein